MNLNYIMKVNRSVGILMIFIFIATLAMFLTGVIEARELGIVAVSFLASISFLYFRKKENLQNRLKFILAIFTMIVAIYGVLLALSANGLIALIGACILTLYLDKKIILIYTFPATIVLIYLQVSNSILGTMDDFILNIVVFLIGIASLFFVCNFGTDLVEDTKKGELRSKQALDDLQHMMETLRTSLNVMSDNVENSYSQIESLTLAGKEMNLTVDVINNGVNTQHSIIEEALNHVEIVNEHLSEIDSFSKELLEITGEMDSLVKDGEESLDDATKKMEEINLSSEESNRIAMDLREYIVQINGALEGIQSISEQTNLLALNASIEAARAGDEGRGFAVVADEVRKLASESGSQANTIDEIMQLINEKVEQVTEKSTENISVTREGNEMLNRIQDQFGNIRSSYATISSYVNREVDSVEETVSLFNKMRSSFDGIIKVSEEQTASTEELLASLEQNFSDTTNIYNEMDNINNEMSNLTNLVEML